MRRKGLRPSRSLCLPSGNQPAWAATQHERTSGKRSLSVTPRALSRKISRLRVAAPVTASYERALVARGVWSDEGVWYTSQKEHWQGWLSEYDGPGAYGRKRWRGRSAEFVYNHIGCPPMLLWLAEAAGLSRSHVLAAKRSALSARRNRATHCALIRKAIPWSAIDNSFINVPG
jgi:hypothetical protein